MKAKKIGKALLFPHVAVKLLITPLSIALLIYSMAFVGTESVIAYISYVLSAYALTVWCFEIPKAVAFFKNFKQNNKYVQRWLNDTRLRINTTLYIALFGNIIYGLFHIFFGIFYKSAWFYAVGAYYVCLAFMRFGLLRHTRRFAPCEKIRTELVKYRATGWIFLLMNIALSVMIFIMVSWGKSFKHHMITTIAIAVYTFAAFIIATFNIVKYRKYNSPAYSATKAISLASACVSMLSLESVMLTVFGEETMTLTEQKWMLGITGAFISVIIVGMAIYMILTSTKKLKNEV